MKVLLVAVVQQKHRIATVDLSIVVYNALHLLYPVMPTSVQLPFEFSVESVFHQQALVIGPQVVHVHPQVITSILGVQIKLVK